MASGWHRANRNSPAAKARQREYNSAEYKRAKQAGQRLVDQGLAHCWRCGRHIPPGSRWHCGHDDHNRAIIRGTECPPCNLKAAAVKGNRLSRTRHARQRPKPVVRRSLLG